MSNVEEVTSGSDKAKVAFAILCVIAGVIAYYFFGKQPLAARIGMVVLGIVAGAALAWTSGPGQRLVAFLKDSVAEAKRVSWPTRKETVQMTMIVFAFSLIASILLWGTDKLLEWVIYDLLLRWK